MKYRVLGNTGLHVSALSVGCMMFGWRAGSVEVNQILENAVASGINFFDTSGSYGRGASEELLGAALKRLNLRSKVIIATKFGLPSEETADRNAIGNTRYNTIRQCELSLRRLQVDHIDLLQIHYPSGHVPIEETLWALDQLVRQGKILYIGTSNFAAWQTVESLWCSERRTLAAATCTQVPYNLLDRRAEREIFEMADHYSLGVIAYGALAEGLLTGKYRTDQPFPDDSRFAMATKGGNYRDRMSPRVMHLVETVKNLASENEVSPASLAISWALHRPQVSTILVGLSKSDQLKELMEAIDIDLAPATLRTLNALNEPGGTLASGP
jgi:aryl-alcohol dehydrogenase-like predicted oxidoreductase